MARRARRPRGYGLIVAVVVVLGVFAFGVLWSYRGPQRPHLNAREGKVADAWVRRHIVGKTCRVPDDPSTGSCVIKRELAVAQVRVSGVHGTDCTQTWLQADTGSDHLEGNDEREVCAAYALQRHGRPYWRQLWIVVSTYVNGLAIDSAQLFEADARAPTDDEAQTLDMRTISLPPECPGVFLSTRTLVSTTDEHYAAYFSRCPRAGGPADVFLLHRSDLTSSSWDTARVLARAKLRPRSPQQVARLCNIAPPFVRNGALGSACA
jgi:hypothetical protein